MGDDWLISKIDFMSRVNSWKNKKNWGAWLIWWFIILILAWNLIYREKNQNKRGKWESYQWKESWTVGGDRNRELHVFISLFYRIGFIKQLLLITTYSVIGSWHKI